MKNLLSLEDLTGWFNDTKLILLDSRICINNASRLKEGTKQEELKTAENQIKRNFGFFNIHWYQCKFISVIQLNKLFSQSKSQKRSFKKLFGKLKGQKYDDQLMELLRSNSSRTGNSFKTKKDILLAIEHCESEIKKQQDTIDGIEKLRNKVYAHTDPENDEAKNVVLAKTVDLEELAESIWNHMNGGFFGSQHIFHHTIEWDLGGIIETVAMDHQAKLEALEAKMKG